MTKNLENSYNTNLASEYLMMSLLHRTGKEAYLSLGNKKGVDIVIKTSKGSICILEVKGVNKDNDWLIGNKGELPVANNLFYALVSFNGKIDELEATADFWLIPSVSLANKTEHKVSGNGKTVYLSIRHIKNNFGDYKNNFDSLNKYLLEN